MKNKTKANCTLYARFFPCFEQVRVISRNPDWSIARSSPVVIGRSKILGLVFRQSFENRSIWLSFILCTQKNDYYLFEIIFRGISWFLVFASRSRRWRTASLLIQWFAVISHALFSRNEGFVRQNSNTTAHRRKELRLRKMPIASAPNTQRHLRGPILLQSFTKENWREEFEWDLWRTNWTIKVGTNSLSRERSCVQNPGHPTITPDHYIIH